MNTAMELIQATNGKFFSVEFVKKDGSTRTMIGRTGVRQGLTGQGLNFSPEQRGLVVVYDVQVKGYRMVNTNTVTSFRCGAMEFTR
jgi:hypothetical protein